MFDRRTKGCALCLGGRARELDALEDSHRMHFTKRRVVNTLNAGNSSDARKSESDHWFSQDGRRWTLHKSYFSSVVGVKAD